VIPKPAELVIPARISAPPVDVNVAVHFHNQAEGGSEKVSDVAVREHHLSSEGTPHFPARSSSQSLRWERVANSRSACARSARTAVRWREGGRRKLTPSAGRGAERSPWREIRDARGATTVETLRGARRGCRAFPRSSAPRPARGGASCRTGSFRRAGQARSSTLHFEATDLDSRPSPEPHVAAQRVRDLSRARSAARRTAPHPCGRASTRKRAPARAAAASTRSHRRRPPTGEHRFNDPVNHTDPSGFFVGGLVGAIVGVGHATAGVAIGVGFGAGFGALASIGANVALGSSGSLMPGGTSFKGSPGSGPAPASTSVQNSQNVWPVAQGLAGPEQGHLGTIPICGPNVPKGAGCAPPGATELPGPGGIVKGAARAAPSLVVRLTQWLKSLLGKGATRAAPTIAKTLGEAVGKEGAEVVREVLKGRQALGALTAEQRAAAAAFYRDVATRTVGREAAAASRYNIARAEFLEGARSSLSPTLPEFIKNGF
jgi:hypothetical protein